MSEEKPKPLTTGELMHAAVSGNPIPPDRALATYADPKNWVQIYDGKTSPAVNYEAKPCEWAFIGPTRPGYELAEQALCAAGPTPDAEIDALKAEVARLKARATDAQVNAAAALPPAADGAEAGGGE